MDSLKLLFFNEVGRLFLLENIGKSSKSLEKKVIFKKFGQN